MKKYITFNVSLGMTTQSQKFSYEELGWDNDHNPSEEDIETELNFWLPNHVNAWTEESEE